MKRSHYWVALMLCAVFMAGALLSGCQDKTNTPEVQAATARAKAAHDAKRKAEQE